MKLIFAAVAISALMSAPAFANADLAKKNACMACHAVDKKLVGPSYNDVAKKYAGQNPFGQRQGIGIAQRSLGRHGYRAPLARTTSLDAFSQCGFSVFLASVFFCHIIVRGAHHPSVL